MVEGAGSAENQLVVEILWQTLTVDGVRTANMNTEFLRFFWPYLGEFSGSFIMIKR